MHADPLDRIGPATLLRGEIESGLSVPVATLFARGITLPFAHPRRWLVSALIPCGLLAGDAVLLYRRLQVWRDGPFSDLQAIDPTIPDTSNPGILLALALGMLLVFLGALCFWFCAWQRDAARGFRDPPGTLLRQSLARLPGYLAAFAVWQAVPGAIIGVMDFIVLRAGSGARFPIDGAPLSLEASPMRFWLMVAGWVVALLFGLWLSARLSPLPALVAAQGWRGALGNAWNLSEGHGLGIALAFLAYGLLGGLITWVGMLSAVMMFRVWEQGETPVAFTICMVGFAGVLITQIWCSSLAALAVREIVGADREVDPTAFD
jgi:hypothetical protein